MIGFYTPPGINSSPSLDPRPRLILRLGFNNFFTFTMYYLTIMRKTKFYKGGEYHIYDRGNRKQLIFHKESDYLRFLSRLFFYAENLDIQVACHCLMPNHYHLILRQNGKYSISKLMHKLNLSYTMYYNQKYSKVGHLFQGKFQAREIKDSNDLQRTIYYVLENPVKDKIVDDWREYEWTYINSQYKNR